MPKLPLLAFVTVAITAALLTAACGEVEEEAGDQGGRATATLRPTGRPTLTLTPALATPTATPRANATAPPVPETWLTYVDPVLGFSLRYPPELTITDTGPSPVRGQRAVVFRSPTDPYRAGFTVAMVANTEALTLEQWVQEFTACLPGTIQQGSIDGEAAISCTSLPEEIPEQAVAFQRMGSVVYLTSIMPPAEFDLVVKSLRL